MNKPILDVACGARMFYFDKNDTRVLFCDKRTVPETFLCDGRKFEISPDLICDFTALPFPDNSFWQVVFDPPHLKRLGEKSYMAIKYGVLGSDWKEVIKHGFEECFRVLNPNGTLIFKWCENQIPVSEILSLTLHKPVFGNRCGKRAQTHWICFLKQEE